MHTVKIEISQQAFDKVMYLLKSLPKSDVKIVGEQSSGMKSQADITAFANHSASLVEDWKDSGEDEIWT